MTALRRARHIRTAVFDDDAVVVLDLQDGSYHVMDPVASAMWLAWDRWRSREPALAALAGEFDVDRAQLARDFDAFLADCAHRRFLEHADASVDGGLAGVDGPGAAPALAAPRASRPWIITAWLTLFRTARALRRDGFSAVYSAAARCPVAPAATPPERLIARAENAFLSAENFFVLSAAPRDCLPRSLALFRFLRGVGLPAVHCIGVRQFPLTMHAWVRVGNRIVIDAPKMIGAFTPIAELCP